MNTIAFAGGGTGGHIFPGLAVIDELRQRNACSLFWIGSSRGVDRSLVESAGVEFLGIPSGKLRRYFSLQNIVDFFRIVAGVFASLAILARRRPTLLFSKGGFVSVPPCVAARILRIPIITHECDFSPGLATRINSRFADDIFVSYAETRERLPARLRDRVTVTGNPVRKAFYEASAQRGREFLGFANEGLPIVFAQGGSLGARQVNDLVSGALDGLLTSFRVVHQTGLAQEPESQPIGRREGYRPFPFIRAEMPDVLSCADIVVARAGANSVWECATEGKPMVLIPLEKGASRGDQVENAEYFASKGAAIVLTGERATSENLLAALRRVIAQGDLMESMSASSARLGSARAASTIAELILARLESVSPGREG